jgi:hypothetical protein
MPRLTDPDWHRERRAKNHPHWIGQIIWRKLQLRTERRREGYVITSSERAKLARLFEKYGIASRPVNLVNSVNTEEDIEPSPGKQEPLIA